MAIYYAIGGLPAIIRVGFIQGILMLIGAVFLYGDLISAGGSLDIWERIPLDVLSMGIIACCVLVPLFLGIFWQREAMRRLICGTAAYLIGSLATRRPEGVKATG